MNNDDDDDGDGGAADVTYVDRVQRNDRIFSNLLETGTLRQVRAFITINNRYAPITFMGDLEVYRAHREAYDEDLFFRIIFSLERYRPEFVQGVLETFFTYRPFIEDARVLITVFTRMFAHSRLEFYVILASYINARTWRSIYRESLAMLDEASGDFRELGTIGLFTCLNMADFHFTYDEQILMTRGIRDEFDIENFDQHVDSTQFIIYAYSFRTRQRRSDNRAMMVRDEKIGMADGEPITETYIGDLEVDSFDHLGSLLNFDALKYSRRQLIALSGDEDDDEYYDDEDDDADDDDNDDANDDNAKTMNRKIRKQPEPDKQKRSQMFLAMFAAARKRLCRKELFEQVLAMANINLPVYLQKDLGMLTINCLRNGVITEWEMMQEIGRASCRERV